ncbi:MAG: hypothetical protein WKF37_00315 [Bryobacteraceae bacterium]
MSVLPSLRYFILYHGRRVTGNERPTAGVKLKVMWVKLLLLGFLAIGASGATIRLYLRDGTHHTVREYKTAGDRVRYFSTERGDWEEIPLDLVDLKKTQTEAVRVEKDRLDNAAIADAEEGAERAQRRQVEAIPMETGVFRIKGDEVRILKQAESKMVTDKRRSLLTKMSPIPFFAGKATVEIDGVKSETVYAESRPEFYIRLAAEERFAIVAVAPSKKSRIVQKWNIVPVSKEIVEENEIIETFKQQLGEGIYKIWPTKPLLPGQYAVIEYTEGKGNIQIWDFAVEKP